VTESAYLAGRLLLAMPGMGDPRFAKAVIAMFVHDAQGALGICLGVTHRSLRFHALLHDLDIAPGARLPGADRRPGRAAARVRDSHA
jgi:putative transcriptional regulator